MEHTKEIQQFDLNQNPKIKDINFHLKKDGVIKIENFLKSDSCDAISKILNGEQKRNSNELTFVHINDAKFFSNALAVSKTSFDLVTSKKVFDISKEYLGNNIRLKCHRAYTNEKYYYFPWHTDNKFDGEKNSKYGIVFIVYLVDTNEGATEFILGSHKYSSKFNKNNFTNNFINENYLNLIKSAKGKKGTAVISDTRTIHRGGFTKNESIKRKSFWFQIDENLDSAERLLINPEFLPKKITLELSNYLGFGRVSGLSVHPVTTNLDRVIPFHVRWQMFIRYTILTFFIPVHWLRLKLNTDFKVFIRKLLGNKVDWN